MKLIRNHILSTLEGLQDKYGGYSGKHVSKIAEEEGVTTRALQKKLKEWRRNDQRFAKIKYLGTQNPLLTIEDYGYINQRVNENPLILGSNLLIELNQRRHLRGKTPIPERSFYRIINNTLRKNYQSPHKWLIANNIQVMNDFSVQTSREVLKSTFSYHKMKWFGKVSLREFSKRIDEAHRWFEKNYAKVNLMEWYPKIVDRAKYILSHLRTINRNEALDIQARLAFEAQVAFLIEAHDRFLDEILFRRGRIRQSRNASRAAIEREYHRKWAARCIPLMVQTAQNPTKENRGKLLEEATNGEKISAETRKALLQKHKQTVEKLWKLLHHHLDGMASTRLRAYGTPAQLVLQLMRKLDDWDNLSHTKKKKVVRERDENFRQLIFNTHSDDLFLQAYILEKFLTFLKDGKIVDLKSWRYGDLGERIANAGLGPIVPMVTKEDIDALAAGTFQFPPDPTTKESPHGLNPASSSVSSEKTPLSHILHDVMSLVLQHNPSWLADHQELFLRQSDGMFPVPKDRDVFLSNLYQTIGFLGRNLRYDDSPTFHGLQRYINRYVTEDVLDLELKHLWNVVSDLSGQVISLILIDTMGIDSRRKSFFSSYHGRYHTIGFADLRAVLLNLIPIFSSNCRSTDSEAMNIIEILHHARDLLGDSLEWYSGNGHTVTYLAAGMSFATYGVIAAGRRHGTPKCPGVQCIKRLRRSLHLVNRVGHFLREYPMFGRMLACRKYWYIDGVNVRTLLENLGSLICWNLHIQGIKLDHLSQLIETANRQKRVLRIVERGVIRAEESRVNLYLKSSELLMLCIVAWKMMKAVQQLKVISNPISLEGVSLFVPA